MDDTPPFVVGVAVCALAFGGLWIWYHYGPTPRERAERRRAKLAKNATRKARKQWARERLLKGA